MGLIDCDSNGRAARWLRAAILPLAVLAVSPGLLAQPALDVPELPQPRHLAAALSDPDSRADALLTLLAVQRLADWLPELD